MTGRSIALNQQVEAAARLAALRGAAERGWADLVAGRYVDVADGDLERLIEQIGRGGQTHV